MENGKSILNKLFILFAIFLAFIIVLAFWLNLKPKEQGLTMADLPNLPQLKTLDLVLRQGRDLDSLFISSVSNNPYSHIGVIISTNPLQVLHASSTDTQNKVAVSEFEDFLSHAKAIAIKRYENLQGGECILAHLKAQVGKEFKLTNDDERLYCTTLIEDAFKEAFELNLRYEKLAIPLIAGEYLFPKAFYEDNKSVVIYEFKP